MWRDVKVTVCSPVLFRDALHLLHSATAGSATEPPEGLQDPDPQDVLVAICKGQVVGAIVTQVAAGRVGWLWLPAMDSTLDLEALPRIAQALIAAGLVRLERAEVRLVQALIAPQELGGEYLGSAGFRRITEMVLMERECRGVRGLPENCADLEFVRFDAGTRADFIRVVQQTYEGTRDCPELDEARSIDEVLEGYAATSEFRPDLWVLARRWGEFVGCMLLTSFAAEHRCDIQYMGVVASARRHGVGQCLVHWALQAASGMGADVLGLSVDSRNMPARRLYGRLGFVEVSRRDVFLHQFDRPEDWRSRDELSTI